MYSKDGERYFVVDSHVHFWDAAPDNQANRYGKGFIECFYDYHRNLSPPEWVWPLEKFERYSETDLTHDLFETGYVDRTIFQPTYLTDFYVNGFNTTEQDGVVAEKFPGKFIVNGAFDPRDGEAGLARLDALASAGTRAASSCTRPSGRASPRAGSSPTTGPTGTWSAASSWASPTSTCTRARRSTR